MKKELFIPLAVIGLSIAFVVISALVIVSRSHPWCIKRKLRIGALLLTLTGATATGCPLASCYEGPSEDVRIENQYYGAEISVDLSQDPVLSGRVEHRQSGSFSFRIVDMEGTEVQAGDIQADDGAFNEDSETFNIAIRTDLASGDYNLYLYNRPAAKITTVDYGWISEFLLHVSGREG